MGDVVLFQGGAVPARVAARAKGALSEMSKALAGGGPSIKRVSIKGGVFRLVHGGKEIAKVEERFLDIVLVNAAANVSRKWYAKVYDPKSEAAEAPDCYSEDGRVPNADAKNRQSDKCDSCPKNIKGSGQGDSRACRFEHRVALLLANDIEGDVLALSVPGASVFGDDNGDYRPLKNYARFLAAQNVDPAEVITRMKFDTDAEAPKVFFKPMRWLTDEEYATAQAKGKSDEAVEAVKMTVAQIDGAKPAAAPLPPSMGERPARPAAEPAAAPAEPPAPAPKTKAKAEDDEPPAPAPKSKAKTPVAATPAEEVDEPEKRDTKPKANAVPAGKTNLAAMVDNWADDE